VKRVDGNLHVAEFCELAGVEIGGNVQIRAGASLVASDIRIGGNLNASRANALDLSSSIIDGNLRLEELGGAPIAVLDTEVSGNVELVGNRTRVELLANDLRGNVEVYANTGGVELVGNTIGGKLECEGNRPPPLLTANRVRNGAEGQCAPLLPGSTPAPAPSTPPVVFPPALQPAPSPSLAPGANPSPSAPAPDTGSSFVPQPEGGGGAAGLLELVWLPLLLLRRIRRRHALLQAGPAR
jgi:hypothetical protein